MMTPERLAEIERILCSNATWWQDHAIELVAEVKSLQTRPLLQLVKKISAERDALRAELERQKELRASTRIMFDEAADERDRLRARVVELEERIRNIRLAPTGAPW